jgi:SAM-dependent methyltransferase
MVCQKGTLELKTFRNENFTELFSVHRAVDVEACICCKGKNFKEWTSERKFPASECLNCGFVFMNPQLDASGLRDYYQNYLSKRRINDEAKMEQRKSQYRLDADLLSNRGYADGVLLDVGCNGGFFLEALGDRYERYGTEIDGESVAYCRKHYADFASNVYHGDLIEAKFGAAQFDIVTLRGVIEHVPNPSEIIREVLRILKPRGVMFICATPNVDSVAARIYRENWVLFHPVQHLWYFSPTTFNRIMNSSGMRLVWKEFPYFGTPYEHFEADLRKFATYLNVLETASNSIVSPPFFESMMSLIYQKE